MTSSPLTSTRWRAWRGPLLAWVLAGVTGWAVLPARAQPAAPASLPPAVVEALQAAGLPADALAAAALPLDRATPAWRWRADVPMQPGSTMKLVTSVVALDRLGPGHRGRTELLTAAPLVRGVLRGDLVMRGGADPELGVPQLWALLVDLRQQGVRELRGDLLLDRSRFHPAREDIGRPPFDESPEFAYNVIPDALDLAGDLLPLAMRSDRQAVHASTVPELPGLTLSSRMTLDDRPCDDWDEGWAPARVVHHGRHTRIELHGSFPRDCSQRTALQLIDRDELAERLFRTLWRELGGRWHGQVREGVAPVGARVLALHESRPWGEILRGMNKQSDNALARLLFLELGVPAMAEDPAATTAELAAREVRRWLEAQGIDERGLVIDNGSGLSRSARITPWQMVSLLAVAGAGPHAPDLMMSLPVAGVDGTLRRRLKDSPAAGWARLKTGSLRNAVALAGYLRDAQGRPWAVAMMINHDPADAGRQVLDALVDSFARTSPGAPEASGGSTLPAGAADAVPAQSATERRLGSR